MALEWCQAKKSETYSWLCSQGLKLTSFPIFGRTLGWGGSVRTPKNTYFDAFLANFWQNPKNSSTLGHKSTLKNNSRNFLLDTIQEPLERGFQNTPYFSQGYNSSIFGGCLKVGNFQNFDLKK